MHTEQNVPTKTTHVVLNGRQATITKREAGDYSVFDVQSKAVYVEPDLISAQRLADHIVH